MTRAGHVAACFIAAMSMGCGAAPAVDGVGGADRPCITDFATGVDYYPVKAELRHARNFSLTYHEHYKVLRARMPATNWGPEVSDVVVLNRCGTPAPPLEGDLAGALILETPVQRFATNSLASALRLRVLGLESAVASELEFFVFRESFEELRDKGYRDMTTISPYNEDYHIFQTSKEEHQPGSFRPWPNH